MKIIAVEEHFSTQTYVDYLRSRKEPPKWEIIEDEDHGNIERAWHHSFFRDRPLSWGLKLIDFEKRLQNMEETGIAMQVLSLTLPGVELFSNEDGKTMAKKTNDELATIISTYPGKFAGYAAIPCQSPLDAAAELERSVKDLGFVGATINSNVNGEYLDEKKYWVILEKAVELNVPVYLHTRELPADMVKPYTAYPCLLGAMFAFGQEASLHAMRLICSGVFDIYPKLKIILGHLGEALPFWQWRIDNHWSQIPFNNKPRRKPSCTASPRRCRRPRR